MEFITCAKCNKTLPIDEFPLKKMSRTIRRKRCSKCRAPGERWFKNNPEKASAANERFKSSGKARALRLRTRFGIDMNQYNALLAKQGGVCAICKTDRPGGSGGCLHVDHDHATGAIRGLLCTNCNRALGYFGDDAERLISAIAYLKKSAGK